MRSQQLTKERDTMPPAKINVHQGCCDEARLAKLGHEAQVALEPVRGFSTPGLSPLLPRFPSSCCVHTPRRLALPDTRDPNLPDITSIAGRNARLKLLKASSGRVVSAWVISSDDLAVNETAGENVSFGHSLAPRVRAVAAS